MDLWLRLRVSNAGGEGLIPYWGTNIPPATQCTSQSKIKNKLKRGAFGYFVVSLPLPTPSISAVVIVVHRLFSSSHTVVWPHGLQPASLLCHGILQAGVLEWAAISFSNACTFLNEVSGQTQMLPNHLRKDRWVQVFQVSAKPLFWGKENWGVRMYFCVQQWDFRNLIKRPTPSSNLKGKGQVSHELGSLVNKLF